MNPIPCITIHQPWASLIALGYKTLETRGHGRFRCLVGKRIGIHAGKAFDARAAAAIAFALGCTTADLSPQLTDRRAWPAGYLLCTAKAYDNIGTSEAVPARTRQALCEADGLYCLRLGALEGFRGRRIIPATGAQGIWYFTPYDDDVPLEADIVTHRVPAVRNADAFTLLRENGGRL